MSRVLRMQCWPQGKAPCGKCNHANGSGRMQQGATTAGHGGNAAVLPAVASSPGGRDDCATV